MPLIMRTWRQGSAQASHYLDESAGRNFERPLNGASLSTNVAGEIENCSLPFAKRADYLETGDGRLGGANVLKPRTGLIRFFSLP